MGGKPCIRGIRVTVGTIVGLIASGATPEEILDDCRSIKERVVLQKWTRYAHLEFWRV